MSKNVIDLRGGLPWQPINALGPIGELEETPLSFLAFSWSKPDETSDGRPASLGFGTTGALEIRRTAALLRAAGFEVTRFFQLPGHFGLAFQTSGMIWTQELTLHCWGSRVNIYAQSKLPFLESVPWDGGDTEKMLIRAASLLSLAFGYDGSAAECYYGDDWWASPEEH